MALTIEQAVARVPFLANAKDVKKTELGGGITNQNFKVEYDGKACVIRITGANTDLLGIRREVEYAANKAAGELGIAPEVLYFIEPEGYLVTRYVSGKHIPPNIITQPDFLIRVARKLRLFHTRRRNWMASLTFSAGWKCSVMLPDHTTVNFHSILTGLWTKCARWKRLCSMTPIFPPPATMTCSI